MKLNEKFVIHYQREKEKEEEEEGEVSGER